MLQNLRLCGAASTAITSMFLTAGARKRRFFAGFSPARILNCCFSMPRMNRIQTPGLVRHVMARGNGRMCIFLDERDYREFEYQLGSVCEEFETECWGYCVMPNHYHAVLRPTKENFSRAIQKLNGDYAKWWNRRHSRVGHTFQGRFKDQIVDSESYLRALCRYVARNPVRARLVDDPSKWKWSSYAAMIGLGPVPAFLKLAPVLAAFGIGGEAELKERFAAFVSSDGESTLDDRIRSNERILGDQAFKTAVRTVIHTGDPTARPFDIPDAGPVLIVGADTPAV
jgi:REP element-mobilizing transposase RayT